MSEVKEGQVVTFNPSDRTKKTFENKKKDSYPAIVTDLNENSVDLTVFGVGETIYVSRVQHESLAPEGRSNWS